MASEPRSASMLERFFDSFLQERNIKWMLALGVFILLASSLLLVAPRIADSTPAWRFVVFLGYSAAAHLAGEWTYRKLGLRTTGTVLFGLTLFLVPILFLVLGRSFDKDTLFINVPMAAAAVGFAVVAGPRVLKHFLRDTQPTFVAAYLVLALAGAVLPLLGDAVARAGAVLPLLGDAVAPVAGLALWLVFAAGATKVARHVFWLVEEQRAPRVFGFLPIALLGSQLLALYLLHLTPHVQMDWLGVGLVLVAIPMLTTADAVARVFQERTGDMVRPLPWSVLAPLGTGLLLVAAGLCLAGVGLAPGNRPHALVIASMLSTGLFALVARRTGKSAFVWAGLLSLTMAYQLTPAFFLDVVIALRDQSAHLVRESRLPYAFYGLTYLPLLAVLTAFGARRVVAGGLFVKPVRLFAAGLPCLLLAVSATHPKAMFPVAAVLLVLFVVQTVVFRSAWLVLPALAAYGLATFGLKALLSEIFEVPLPADFVWFAMTAGAGLLFAASRWLDRWLAQLDAPRWLASACGHASLAAALALALAVAWLAQLATIHATGAWLPGACIAGLLLIHGLHRVQPILSAAALANVLLVATTQALLHEATLAEMVAFGTYASVAIWTVGMMLRRYPTIRLSRAYALAAEAIGTGLLATGLAVVYLPLYAIELLQPFQAAAFPHEFVEMSAGVGLLARGLVVAWCVAAACRWSHAAYTSLALLVLFASVGSAFLASAGVQHVEWLPTVWVATGLACLPVSLLLRRRIARDSEDQRRWLALDEPLTWGLLGVFGLAAAATTLTFAPPLRVAGGLGVVGLIALAVRQRADLRKPILLLVNWQVVTFAMSLLAPECPSIYHLTPANLREMLTPLAALAAASVLLWQPVAQRAERSPLYRVHHGILQALTAVTLLATMATLPSLGVTDLALAMSAFALVAVAEGLSANRRQSELHAWCAIASVAAAVGYLLFFNVIGLGGGMGMFVVLGVGMAIWLLREIAVRREPLRVFVRPLETLAFAMPFVAVILGVRRHLVVADPAWRGVNSLALLLSAAFYFWRGIESRRRDLLALAAVVFNIALALLWRELEWSDPQFFLVPIGLSVLALGQLFSHELPVKLHDPVRYLGALVILVSPIFHIVDGSWIHLFTLMVASVSVAFLGIGLRVRALMYAGTAFLLADLAAMLVRGGFDHPNLLWVAGLSLGAAVLALGAYCERHREDLLQRMRLVAESLQEWK